MIEVICLLCIFIFVQLVSLIIFYFFLTISSLPGISDPSVFKPPEGFFLLRWILSRNDPLLLLFIFHKILSVFLVILRPRSNTPRRHFQLTPRKAYSIFCRNSQETSRLTLAYQEV